MNLENKKSSDVITFNIQFCSMNVIPLLSKPYVNGVTSTEQNLSLKYCQSLEQKVC